VINRHPEITAVEIQGHTDNQGTPTGNQTLSDSRSASVRDALVRLGVDASRLSARGFGQTRPLRPNLTAAGRAANRRVEFHITRAPR
jgi:outer membrane protein OmpA-like peptidoglycan-associated protein